MSLTDRKVDTKRLTFGDDWIEVRTERMYGDTVAAQKVAARRVPIEDGEKPNRAARRGKGEAAATRIEFDISAFNLALVTNMTVAWSDDVPITEENYQKVPDDIVSVVLEEITGVSILPDELEDLENDSTSASEPQEEPSN